MKYCFLTEIFFLIPTLGIIDSLRNSRLQSKIDFISQNKRPAIMFNKMRKIMILKLKKKCWKWNFWIAPKHAQIKITIIRLLRKSLAILFQILSYWYPIILICITTALEHIIIQMTSMRLLFHQGEYLYFLTASKSSRS